MRRPNDTRWAQSGRTERGAPFGCYCTSPACTSSPSAECQVTCKYTKQLPWTMDHDIKQMTLEDTAGSGQASDNETRLDWEKRRSASSRQYGRHLQQQTETARGNVTLRPGHVDLEDPFAETSHSTDARERGRGFCFAQSQPSPKPKLPSTKWLVEAPKKARQQSKHVLEIVTTSVCSTVLVRTSPSLMACFLSPRIGNGSCYYCDAGGFHFRFSLRVHSPESKGTGHAWVADVGALRLVALSRVVPYNIVMA
ncbi:hypothetical protein CI102_14196 [Trichoderma harzianum]|nr:hypothetical protein CI102_14196 [Trichoderma harzianum]